LVARTRRIINWIRHQAEYSGLSPIDKTLLVFSSILFFFIQKLILAFLQIISCSSYLATICFNNYGMSFGRRTNISLNDTKMGWLTKILNEVRQFFNDTFSVMKTLSENRLLNNKIFWKNWEHEKSFQFQEGHYRRLLKRKHWMLHNPLLKIRDYLSVKQLSNMIQICVENFETN